MDKVVPKSFFMILAQPSQFMLSQSVMNTLTPFMALLILTQVSCASKAKKSNQEPFNWSSPTTVLQLDYGSAFGATDPETETKLRNLAQTSAKNFGFELVTVGLNVVPVLNHVHIKFNFEFLVKSSKNSFQICDGFANADYSKVSFVCRWTTPLRK